jgi:hypothetical protein
MFYFFIKKNESRIKTNCRFLLEINRKKTRKATLTFVFRNFSHRFIVSIISSDNRIKSDGYLARLFYLFNALFLSQQKKIGEIFLSTVIVN